MKHRYRSGHEKNAKKYSIAVRGRGAWKRMEEEGLRDQEREREREREREKEREREQVFKDVALCFQVTQVQILLLKLSSSDGVRKLFNLSKIQFLLLPRATRKMKYLVQLIHVL
jgi:hypothetical protein